MSVRFNDEAVGEFFDNQVDLGRRPEQFARIWSHTHPGMSPEPSALDEDTFTRVFGACQWAVMFVLAQDNRTYARLSFHVGPGGAILIPVEVDYGCEFERSDRQLWDTEYEANVKIERTIKRTMETRMPEQDFDQSFDQSILACDIVETIYELDPARRHAVLSELASQPDLWDDVEEVLFT